MNAKKNLHEAMRRAQTPLTALYHALTEDAAWGPDTISDTSDVAQGKAGAGGAMNFSDAEDTMDRILNDCAQALSQLYDATDDELQDFIVAAAQEAADEGQLPPFPDTDATDAEVAEWDAAAGPVFKGLVLKYANEATQA